jgi:hypothetical protein
VDGLASWLKRSLILIVLALVLTGCFKLEVTTDIRADGSGTHTMIIAMERSAQMGLDNLYEIRRMAEEAGAEVEKWEDERHTGYQIVYEFADLDEMVQQLEAQSTEVGFGVGNDITAYKEAGRYYLTIRSVGEEAWIPVQHEASYSVIMPGRIVSYSPENTASVPRPNQVVWELDLNNPNYELSAVGEARGGPQVPCCGLVPGAMVIAAALFGRRSSKSVARPSDH